MITEKDKKYIVSLIMKLIKSEQIHIKFMESRDFLNKDNKNEYINSRKIMIHKNMDLIDRIISVDLEAELDVNYNEESTFKFDQDNVSPFPDWNGSSLSEGDVIIHPSGEEGTIFFKPEEKEDYDKWWVAYETGPGRLILQTGERGQAIKKQE